jgi:hypothetical protein
MNLQNIPEAPYNIQIFQDIAENINVQSHLLEVFKLHVNNLQFLYLQILSFLWNILTLFL